MSNNTTCADPWQTRSTSMPTQTKKWEDLAVCGHTNATNYVNLKVKK